MVKGIIAGVAGAYAAVSGFFFGYPVQPPMAPPPPLIDVGFPASTTLTTLRALSIKFSAASSSAVVPPKKSKKVTADVSQKKAAPKAEVTAAAKPPPVPPPVPPPAVEQPAAPALSENEKAAREYYWSHTGCGGIDEKLFVLCAAYAFRHDSILSFDGKKKMSALSAIQAAAKYKAEPTDTIASNEKALAVWNQYRPKLEALHARISLVGPLMSQGVESQIWSLCADKQPLPASLSPNAYQKEVLTGICTQAGARTGVGGWTYIDGLLADVVLALQASVSALMVERDTKLAEIRM